MNTALHIQNNKQLEKKHTQDSELRDEIQTFILGSELSKKLTPTQRDLCIKTALAFNLNPLKREVHFIPYNNDIKIVVGYEVYLKKAEKTGKLDGWKVDVLGQGPDMKAVVTIHRKDWTEAFIHETYFTEARQSSPIWLKMPRFMLKKVAIAQAFRLAFPEEMGGLPYMPEEIGVTITDHSERYISETKNNEKFGILKDSDKNCEVCGRGVTDTVKAFSKRKYGRILCMPCQKLDLNAHNAQPVSENR
jgi:phage recombination protein Bet